MLQSYVAVSKPSLLAGGHMLEQQLNLVLQFVGVSDGLFMLQLARSRCPWAYRMVCFYAKRLVCVVHRRHNAITGTLNRKLTPRLNKMLPTSHDYIAAATNFPWLPFPPPGKKEILITF